GGQGGGSAPAPEAPAAGRGAPAADGGRGAPAAGGPGGGRGGYSLVDSTIAGQMQKPEASVLDGIDTSLTGIAQYAATPPRALTDALTAILGHAKAAQKAFAEGNDAGTAVPVEAGLTAIRALRAQLGSM